MPSTNGPSGRTGRLWAAPSVRRWRRGYRRVTVLLPSGWSLGVRIRVRVRIRVLSGMTAAGRRAIAAAAGAAAELN